MRIKERGQKICKYEGRAVLVQGTSHDSKSSFAKNMGIFSGLRAFENFLPKGEGREV